MTPFLPKFGLKMSDKPNALKEVPRNQKNTYPGIFCALISLLAIYMGVLYEKIDRQNLLYYGFENFKKYNNGEESLNQILFYPLEKKYTPTTYSLTKTNQNAQSDRINSPTAQGPRIESQENILKPDAENYGSSNIHSEFHAENLDNQKYSIQTLEDEISLGRAYMYEDDANQEDYEDDDNETDQDIEDAVDDETDDYENNRTYYTESHSNSLSDETRDQEGYNNYENHQQTSQSEKSFNQQDETDVNPRMSAVNTLINRRKSSNDFSDVRDLPDLQKIQKQEELVSQANEPYNEVRHSSSDYKVFPFIPKSKLYQKSNTNYHGGFKS